MNEKTEVLDDAEDSENEESGQGRQRSKIAFPYMDLDAGAAIAQAIRNNVGTGYCSLQQLSAWLNQSLKSSGFRVQIAAARLFGLIESEGTDSYRLTALGNRVADPAHARKARAESFLAVPLFAALFQKYKEGTLPPTAALEREIAALGVAEKQKDRARQVFERSAEQAAFFEHGKNRLVPPAIKGEETYLQGKDDGKKSSSGGGDGDRLDLDPLLMALLVKIPKKGDGWPEAARLRWFKTFAMNVSQVYDNDESPVDLNITAGSKP